MNNDDLKSPIADLALKNLLKGLEEIMKDPNLMFDKLFMLIIKEGDPHLTPIDQININGVTYPVACVQVNKYQCTENAHAGYGVIEIEAKAVIAISALKS